ncbi:MAG: hypothetical protein K6G22_06475 [Lachnospiraceae bacterium]|nr:hypothetical protein [Lachnospiraceae bacterium]
MMLFERWTFREKLHFLEEWKEVLKEPDEKKLKLILQEILERSTVSGRPAYAEVAGALLKNYHLVPALGKRLRKGSDLSEMSLSVVLRGEYK